jgi:inward rectifier potassium channel
MYHLLLVSSWPRLLGILALLYVAVNTGFALAYLIGGDGIAGARPGSFVDAFFFSVQTLATIGYGKMVPHSFLANVLVSVEALFGLVGVAMVTGLVFAKFSRPTARVLFSRVAVIAHRDGIPSLMFRVANARGNNIVEAHMHVVFARNETTAEGESVRRFYDLELARRQNTLFALSWTAIHPIGETSPFHRASRETLAAEGAQLIVSVIGFDESFAQTVHARHSYGVEDIVWGARFVDILSAGPDGQRLVDYRRFHDVVPTPAGERRAGPTGML